MESKEFLRPVLNGRRFEGHAIPLGFLRELATLNDIIQEVAKAEYLKFHPGRQRVPRGFKDDITLSLEGVGEGSAVPFIVIFYSMLGFLPSKNLEFYELARDHFVDAIEAASQDRPLTDHIPGDVIKSFQYFGDSLRDDEAIEFRRVGNANPVRYTKEVRRKILLSQPEVQEILEQVELRGKIVALDHVKKTFKLQLTDGREIPGIIPPDHYDNIEGGIGTARRGGKVALQATGARDRTNKLIRIEKIVQSTVLDVLDIPARLDDLRALKAGWMEGEGQVFDPAALNWLEDATSEGFAEQTPLPRIYPTPDGFVSLEWSPNSWHADLELDLVTKMGEYQALNFATKEERTQSFDLQESEGWAALNQELSVIHGGAGE